MLHVVLAAVNASCAGDAHHFSQLLPFVQAAQRAGLLLPNPRATHFSLCRSTLASCQGLRAAQLLLKFCTTFTLTFSWELRSGSMKQCSSCSCVTLSAAGHMPGPVCNKSQHTASTAEKFHCQHGHPLSCWHTGWHARDLCASIFTLQTAPEH